MTDLLQFDDEASRAVEDAYRTADVVEQRRTSLQTLALRPGERVLDIGSGPGFLAWEMAAAVGPGGRVHGIDPSESMLALARRREPIDGAAPVDFSQQGAIGTSFPDATFDAVVATQVYEYVDDMPAALAEARRVLVEGGRLLILDTDFDSIVWRSSNDELMRRVLDAWDEHLAHRDLPRRLPELLEAAGLAMTSCQIVPLLNVGFDRDCFSARMIPVIERFVGGRRGVSAADARAWAADLEAMGPRYFFSLNRYLFLATR
jgi:SAM-dependent methyltransferase